MGKARGKGKKLTEASYKVNGSGEEEQVPAQKRRGRPQKLLKVETGEDVSEKIEVEDSEDSKIGPPDKTVKMSSADNGKKRRRNALSKKNIDSEMEKNSNGTRSVASESSKCDDFQRNANRRKNKPYRAAEAGVKYVRFLSHSWPSPQFKRPEF